MLTFFVTTSDIDNPHTMLEKTKWLYEEMLKLTTRYELRDNPLFDKAELQKEVNDCEQNILQALFEMRITYKVASRQASEQAAKGEPE